MCLGLTPGHVFLPHFLALCVSLKQQIQTHTGKKTHAHLLFVPILATNTNTHRQTQPLNHTQPSAFDSVSIFGALGLLLLLLQSSTTLLLLLPPPAPPSLLDSVLLSCSHLLRASDNQQHNWSEAEVVDATSCHCGLWWCRNQRCIVYWWFSAMCGVSC